MNTDSDETIPKLRSGEENCDFQALPFLGNDFESLRGEFYDADICLHPENESVKDQTEVERLKLRVRQLEYIVEKQTNELLRAGTQGRNYKACLEELARSKTECSVLEKDRDRYYNEKEFYLVQSGELSLEKSKLKEQLHEKNQLLLEHNAQIKELQEHVRSLTEKCTGGNPFQQGNEQRRECQDDVTMDSGINSETTTIPNKRRFSTTKTQHPVCKNCNTVFCHLKPVDDDECSFHLARPQPLKVWRSNLVGAVLPGFAKLGKPYKYWPCCEQVSINEPPGCHRLRKHEIVQEFGYTKSEG